LTRSSVLLPNSYQAPNFLVDDLLRHLTGPQAKVLMVLCRKTFGYQKLTDHISLSQFEEIAGTSRSSTHEALDEFVRVGLLLKVPNSGHKGTSWSLNLEADPDLIVDGLKAARESRKPVICTAQRTSTPGELVLPAVQDRYAWSTRSSTPGEHTETKNQKPILERESKWDSSVEEVFRFFCERIGKGPQYELSWHRRQLALDGLRAAARYARKSGSASPDTDAVALLKLAIERMKCDKWHNGDETGTKYLDWDQLFTSKTYRDRKLVDYWLNDDNSAKWEAA
jgi:hypothetical protein